jgi:hypothetical protein
MTNDAHAAPEVDLQQHLSDVIIPMPSLRVYPSFMVLAAPFVRAPHAAAYGRVLQHPQALDLMHQRCAHPSMWSFTSPVACMNA